MNKRFVLAGIIGGALVIAVGVALWVFGVPSEKTGDREVVAKEPADWTIRNGHAFLPAIDIGAPSGSLTLGITKAVQDAIENNWDQKTDISLFGELFVDEDLTFHASAVPLRTTSGIEWFPREGEVEVADNDGMEDLQGSVPDIKASAANEWGLYETYYLVRYIDEDGEKLETPLVQPYTLNHDALQQVEFSVSEPDVDGNVEFSWDEVDDADEYFIISGRYHDVRGVRSHTVVGKTTKPTWSSDQSVSSSTVEHDQWEIMTHHGQHSGFEMYRSSDDQTVEFPDRVEMENNGISEFEVSIIATNGDTYSPVLATEPSESLAKLPTTMASRTWDERTGSLWNVDDLDEIEMVSMPYVSVDGTVRETSMEIDPDDFATAKFFGEDGDEYPVVAIQVIGTMQEYEVGVRQHREKVKKQIKNFNKDALKAFEEGNTGD